ncbi:MAG: hypothetical protein ABJA74_17400 [Lapillicoccus sp.]
MGLRTRAIDADTAVAKAADLARAEAVTAQLEKTAPREAWIHLRGQVLMVQAELAYVTREPWEAYLRSALDLGLGAGNDLLASAAYASLHQYLVTDYRFDAAAALYGEGITFTDDRDITTYSTCLRGRRALALVAVGRWDEAERTARVVLRTPGSPVNLLTSQVAAGLLRARRGESDRDGLLATALAAATSLDEAEWLTPTCCAAAEAAWLQGDVARARADLASARARIGELNVVEDAQLSLWEARLGLDGAGRSPRADGLPEPLRRHVDRDYLGAVRAWDAAAAGTTRRSPSSTRGRRRRSGPPWTGSRSSVPPPPRRWHGGGCGPSAPARYRSERGPRRDATRPGSPGGSTRSSNWYAKA